MLLIPPHSSLLEPQVKRKEDHLSDLELVKIAQTQPQISRYLSAPYCFN